MDKSLLNPIGPLGSILIGVAMIAVHYAQIMPLGWLGLAFILGGVILLMVRIMNNKKKDLKNRI